MADLPPFLIRADAGIHLGIGHVMRCLALAQAWQEVGGTAQFVLATSTPALEARLACEGMETSHLAAQAGSASDAEQTTALAWQQGAAWLIVDGYHFNAAYQRAIKESGLYLLSIDDYGHAGHYWADLVLNQNIQAAESLYPRREPYTQLLLGTSYALLRREFWPWRDWQREIPVEGRRILVTMGGADRDNVTLRVLEALDHLEGMDLEVQVVIGGSNLHRESLTAYEDAGICQLIQDSSDMPRLMAEADFAVSAAGSTCWELAFMQLPSILVILADNQSSNAIGLDRAGAATSLGWHQGVSPEALAHTLRWLLRNREARATMAGKGRSLVDGTGAHRVAGLLGKVPVRIRPASEEDCALLFQWANDPLTRQMSFHPNPIRWEDHVLWFERLSRSLDVLLLIAERWSEGRWAPVGQVRIDVEGVVSISISSEHRGQGFARPTLQAAITSCEARFPGKTLTAYIKPENGVSQAVFRRAGFLCIDEVQVSGQSCLRYVYRQQGKGLDEGIPKGDGHV
jgi:UDP-2,4-diacetamido-2,4,6-trideoxy-beta-L-altropyranose hydrolase